MKGAGLQGMQVLVLYSYPDAYKDDRPQDIAAETEVEEVAIQVHETLLSQGYRSCTQLIYNAQDIKYAIREYRPEVVFNLCEALEGSALNEPEAARVIEEQGIEHTGSTFSTLAIALDKGRAKEKLISYDVPTPPFSVLLEEGTCKVPMDFPLIVKPLREDGSLGIDKGSVVYDELALKERVKYIHRTYNGPSIVESYIPGREFNVAILGEGEALTPLPLSEMDFSQFPYKERICTYEAKWVKDSPEYRGSIPVCPAQVCKEVEERVKSVAMNAYRALGLRDYGRVDIRLSEDGVPYVIDVNPNPSISRDSGVVRTALAAGLSYERLISKIVVYTLNRRKFKGGTS